MNLWHDIPRGENTPGEVNVIIETPKNSPNKYEIDKATGLIALDRANYSAAPFPFDYGYVPRTLWDDGDALDVVVLATYPLQTGILVRVRVVGVMYMIDTGESDWKIIGVPVDDNRWEDVHGLGDVNKHSLKEVQHFFETYKELKKGEKGMVVIEGFGDKKEAERAVLKSFDLYDTEFNK